MLDMTDNSKANLKLLMAASLFWRLNESEMHTPMLKSLFGVVIREGDRMTSNECLVDCCLG